MFLILKFFRYYKIVFLFNQRFTEFFILNVIVLLNLKLTLNLTLNK